MKRNGPPGARAERVPVVLQLRAEGWLLREIAAELGISTQYVADMISDPDKTKQLARRAGYQGECETCGAPTDGSNGAARAPRYCLACVNSSPEARARYDAKRVWTPALILDRIREWAEIYGEPPAVPDWSPQAARFLHDEDRARRFEDAGGHWPWFTVVYREWGSWNTAMQMAGFEPREPSGGGGNIYRQRRFRELASA